MSRQKQVDMASETLQLILWGEKHDQKWKEFIHGRLTHKPKRTETIPACPEIAYRDEGWSGCEDWLGSGNPEGSDSASMELPEGTRECMCKGTLINCPDCDGKGYYYI